MFDEIIRQIMLRQKELSEQVLRYPLASHEQYQRLVGKFEGLDETLAIIKSVVEESEKDLDN